MTRKIVHLATSAAFIIGIGAPSALAQVESRPGAGQWVVTASPGGGIFFTSSGENDSFGDYGLGGAETMPATGIVSMAASS